MLDGGAFLSGLGTGLSLILAIGAQNAFVLKQGLLRHHVFAVCAFCALSDAILIAAGGGGRRGCPCNPHRQRPTGAMDATADFPPQQTRSNLVGIGWMLVTGLFFVAVNGTVRWIGDDLPAAQSAFLRFVFGLLFLAVPLARALRTGFPAPVWRRFVLRGAIHVCAVVLWFYAMARIPVAEVTAIGFINPIVVTAGAALFLGERLGWRRVLAIGVALGGALIVLRPGVRDLEPGHLAQLCAAVCFGSSYLIAKQLTRVSGGADDRDAAGGVFAADLGQPAWRPRLRGSRRCLGHRGRRGDDRRNQLDHLARGAAGPASRVSPADRRAWRARLTG